MTPLKSNPISITVLLTAVLLLTLITISPARAQDALTPDKPATVQTTPANESHPQQVSIPRREARRKPESNPDTQATKTATSIPPMPEPTQAAKATPQAVGERLPFMAGNESDSHEQAPSATGLLLRTLGALLLIVGLIVAAAWGMRRFGGARFGAPTENAPPLVVLNSLSLGERRSLTIVRFGDRTLLLGSTAHTVTLLAEADADEPAPEPRSVAEILNDDQPAVFSHELMNATTKLAAQPELSNKLFFIA
jgi:flagellar biosynthetic protein FliO